MNRITYNSIHLVNSSPVKFLGIHLDSSLSWYAHIDMVCKKMSKGLYSLRRLREAVDTNALLSVYYAQIFSVFSYGIAVWGNSSKSVDVFILQKRAVRIICNEPQRNSCRPFFIKLNILTFPSLYVLTLLLYVHSNLEKFEFNSEVHNYNTRNRNSIRTHFLRYSKSQKNWYCISTKLYNFLPSQIKNLTHEKFKSKLKNILIAECLYRVDEFYDINFNKYKS